MKPKLQKVCNFYLSGMSMRESLLKAGYSDSYASHNSWKFLKNREVIAYVQERKKAEAEAALADDIFLLDDLKRIIKDPNAAPIEKIEARKLLEKIIGRNKEIEAKFKSIEVAKELAQTPNQIIVDYNVVKKDN